jgi:hypothetical protein
MLLTHFAVVLLFSGVAPHAESTQIGCPPMHDGQPLIGVQLFDGDPANKIETVPENGRFVVPRRPPSSWDHFPPSTLGCSYRGTKEMVTVVLPRYIRVCEFPHYPQVRCH